MSVGSLNISQDAAVIAAQLAGSARLDEGGTLDDRTLLARGGGTPFSRTRDSVLSGDGDTAVLQDQLEGIRALNPDETRILVSSLSDRELATWGNAIYAETAQPSDYSISIPTPRGLSAGERQDLMNHLAQDLEGAELARVGRAFGDLDSVGDAASRFASPIERVEFIAALAPYVDAGTTLWDTGGGGNISALTGNGATRAVVDNLASLSVHPQLLANAIGRLDGAQLSTVVDAAAGKSVYIPPQSMPSQNADPAVLVSILDGASGIETAGSPFNLEQKERVLRAGLDELNDLRGMAMGDRDGVTAPIARSLGNLYDSSAVDLTDVLRSVDPQGNVLTNLMKNLVVTGQHREVSAIFATLKTADGSAPDTFYDPDGNNANARRLGYAVGNTIAGVQELSTERNYQARVMGDVLATIASFVAIPYQSTALPSLLADKSAPYIADALLIGSGDGGPNYYMLGYPGGDEIDPDADATVVYQQAVDHILVNKDARY